MAGASKGTVERRSPGDMTKGQRSTEAYSPDHAERQLLCLNLCRDGSCIPVSTEVDVSVARGRSMQANAAAARTCPSRTGR